MLAIDSPKKGARAELSDIEKVVANNPELIRLLPAVPKLKRTFNAESQSLAFSMNASSDRRQAKAAEGNIPHWLPLANLLEPSARMVTVSKYLSIMV